MNLASLPRRTISLATDDGKDPVQIDRVQVKRDRDRAWRRDNPLAYKRSQKIKGLKVQIRTAYRIQEMLRGKIPTLERALAKLLEGK